MINLGKQKLRELIIGEGLADEQTFETLYEDALRRKQNPANVFISKNIVGEDQFYNLLSRYLNIPRIDLRRVEIDERHLNIIPENIARQKRAIIVGKNEDGSYNVAMENPIDLDTMNFLSLRLSAPIRAYLATDDDLNRGYTLYGQKQAEDFKRVINESIQESLRYKAKGIEEAAKDIPIVAIIDNLLAYAVSSRASDIHFEILDDAVMIRFRIDGILHEIIRMPKEIHPAVVARIKILSGLRIDEHNAPQDGRFRYNIGDGLIDVRVSIIPVFYGEKVELRLLDAAQKPLSLEELGMLKETRETVRRAINKSYGMFLVCGPTGSGKTTTLYSIMNILNQPKVNIVTVEDPIEYDMRYVNQIQLNPAAGLTFASGLRSILRQDPDIIMVGEIRDTETAAISVQSALTGHLVLSSLHTNDAPTTVPRLMDMNVKRFLVSAVLNLVSAQRLVRKVCDNCKVAYKPNKEMIDSIKEQLNDLGVPPEKQKIPEKFYKGEGCDSCNGLGYRGRIGIFEVMEVNDRIKEFINSEDFNLEGLQELARQEGMKSMFEDGLEKVGKGVTTMEEVFRVIRE
jgi:type IV pilus assembly protein PilB